MLEEVLLCDMCKREVPLHTAFISNLQLFKVYTGFIVAEFMEGSTNF